jgi:hypothetical protein
MPKAGGQFAEQRHTLAGGRAPAYVSPETNLRKDAKISSGFRNPVMVWTNEPSL